MNITIDAGTFIEWGHKFYSSKPGTVEVTIGAETRRIHGVRHVHGISVEIAGRVMRGRKWFRLRYLKNNDGSVSIEAMSPQSRLRDAQWEAFKFDGGEW